MKITLIPIRSVFGAHTNDKASMQAPKFIDCLVHTTFAYKIQKLHRTFSFRFMSIRLCVQTISGSKIAHFFLSLDSIRLSEMMVQKKKQNINFMFKIEPNYSDFVVRELGLQMTYFQFGCHPSFLRAEINLWNTNGKYQLLQWMKQINTNILTLFERHFRHKELCARPRKQQCERCLCHSCEHCFAVELVLGK